MNYRSDHSISFHPSSKEFEQLYIDLRLHEKRLYTDEEVAWLPEIGEDHIHREEWAIRKNSCKKLLRYLRHKNRPLKILEVGCGNGWLSYQLSQIRHSRVTGLDVNLPELQQAERVFAAISNLQFVYGDLASFPGFEKFDIIVFAASIQYFPSFPDVMKTSLDHLNEKGEIHIIDSRFYYETDIEDARKRSRDYFHSKGFDKMNAFYFHHSLKELDHFNSTILFDPNSALNKFFKKKSPFHWICIKK
jgi:ubiquinone/menaquinone biosynthesis C-methylase UbiE